ncbi:MAG TPA: phosphonatase-like hydrolase [Chitinophagaceae bacterium]|nr:phosphonatase-like hydrolase [Chitinophagaceae bacterium]
MIKMVVFDMAGTVVDEQNVVYKTLQDAINHAGMPVSLKEVLISGAGKEKKEAIKDMLAAHAPKQTSEAIDNIYQHFLEKLDVAYSSLQVVPVKGAEEVFDILRSHGIKVTLNTGYNHATAENLLKKLGWFKGIHYDELVTASDVMHARPKPDMILRAMQLEGINNPAEVLKIGDSVVDIEEGKNAGCGITVGITTGAQTREQLTAANPDYIIDGLLELPKLAGL